MCLIPTNLNNIIYNYNECDMCLTPQTRTKLIIVIENMANMNKMVSPSHSKQFYFKILKFCIIK